MIHFAAACTEGTAALVDTLAVEAPHLFQGDALAHDTRGLPKVLFVLAQVDRIGETQGLDGGDDGAALEPQRQIESMKQDFRAMLRSRRSLVRFPGFADSVPVFATGISSSVLAGRTMAYDIGALFEALSALQAHSCFVLQVPPCLCPCYSEPFVWAPAVPLSVLLWLRLTR